MTVVIREFTYIDANIEATNYGGSGWKLTNMPTFDPCHSEHVVCHDAFEHHPDDLPNIEHEMMAFGAIYFIRVNGDWSAFKNDWRGVHGVMFADINLFLGEQSKWVISDCDEPICGELVSHYYRQMDKLKESLNSALLIDTLPQALSALERAFKWISKGYLRATKRWEGYTSAQVCKLFEDTTKEIEEISRKHDRKHGDRLTVKFDTKRLKSTVKYVRPRKKRCLTA